MKNKNRKNTNKRRIPNVLGFSVFSSVTTTSPNDICNLTATTVGHESTDSGGGSDQSSQQGSSGGSSDSSGGSNNG